MKQLEVRFYSLDELAEAIDRKRDSHFAGNAKADLTKWGYEWEWKNGRGVVITKAPQTAKERLAEIMNRRFGLDIQVEVYAFACFMWMLLMVDGFDSMPWAVRVEEIEFWFGVEVTERTLRRWSARLLATDNLHKSQDRTIWRTERHGRDVSRNSVEPDNAEYLRYKSRQAELITEYMNLGLNKSRAWGDAFKQRANVRPKVCQGCADGVKSNRDFIFIIVYCQSCQGLCVILKEVNSTFDQEPHNCQQIAKFPEKIALHHISLHMGRRFRPHSPESDSQPFRPCQRH